MSWIESWNRIKILQISVCVEVGRGDNGDWLLTVPSLFGGELNVLILDRCDHCTALWIYKKPLSYILWMDETCSKLYLSKAIFLKKIYWFKVKVDFNDFSPLLLKENKLWKIANTLMGGCQGASNHLEEQPHRERKDSINT